MKHTVFIKSLLIAGLTMSVFTGCGDSDSNNNDTEDKISVLSPAQIVQKSEADYNNNMKGVITAQTLTHWMDDWQANKPASVTDGRLIVLQAGPTTLGADKAYLKGNGTDVLVYDIGAAGACDPSYKRFDGFSMNYGALLSGEQMDYRINGFQLDPEKDFLVVAIGDSSVNIREITRTWWVLAYWGWDLDRLAFLNGSVSYNFAPSSNLDNYLTDAWQPPQPTQEFHMYTLKTDRTSLHIYTKEMMDVIKQGGEFIADARGDDEFDGSAKSKSHSLTCGPNHDQQCYTAYRGNIKGSVSFPYTDILIMDDQQEDINGDGAIDASDSSFKFKSPADLEALFASKGYTEGKTVYAYCRTGRKATLLTLASTVILGYPVRMYDASWISWGSMAYVSADANDSSIFPQDSIWRTDVSELSNVIAYNDANETEPQASFEFDFSATDTNQIANEDKAYLQLGLSN